MSTPEDIDKSMDEWEELVPRDKLLRGEVRLRTSQDVPKDGVMNAEFGEPKLASKKRTKTKEVRVGKRKKGNNSELF